MPSGGNILAFSFLFEVTSLTLAAEMIFGLEKWNRYCFFETSDRFGADIIVDFQVVRGGGNQAINLEVFSPNKTRIEFIEKKGRGMWSGKAEELGDYEICFDNEKDFAPKMIYFDIAFGKEDPGASRLDYEQREKTNKENMELANNRMTSVESSLEKIAKYVQYVQGTERGRRVQEHRRRYHTENLASSVTTWSIIVTIGIIITGFLYVAGIRHLFKGV